MQVSLTWTPVPGALFYNIYRGIASGGPYTLIGTSNPNPYGNSTNAGITPKFLDGTVVNGQDYYYVVSATTIDGESPYSTEIVCLAPSQPAAPVGPLAIVT